MVGGEAALLSGRPISTFTLSAKNAALTQSLLHEDIELFFEQGGSRAWSKKRWEEAGESGRPGNSREWETEARQPTQAQRSRSKNGHFSGPVQYGPMGSEESVMITSYSSTWSRRYWNPSPTTSLALGLSKPQATVGMCFLQTSTTCDFSGEPSKGQIIEALGSTEGPGSGTGRRWMRQAHITYLGINLTQDGLLDARVLDHLPQHSAVASANNQNLVEGRKRRILSKECKMYFCAAKIRQGFV